METQIDLDLNYNNVQSDVLNKRNKRKHDVYQDIVAYASGMGVDKNTVDEIIRTSSAEGDDEKTKVRNVLDTLKQVAQGAQEWGATREGDNLGETLKGGQEGMKDNQPPMDVKILGLDPLVFSLVSLGVVIAVGIGIARLGRNK